MVFAAREDFQDDLEPREFLDVLVMPDESLLTIFAGLRVVHESHTVIHPMRQPCRCLHSEQEFGHQAPGF